MKIIISETQYNVISENENLIFAKKFFEKFGRLPYYKVLETSRDIKVGDIYPEHSKYNVNLKTFVNKYFSDINDVLSFLEQEYKITRGKYVSIDKKYRFRSLFESILYNIFVLEGVADQIIYEPKEFLKECGKIPDFYWKNKNLFIEIAGMESERYFEKINKGKECLERKGYQVLVLEVRTQQKTFKYLEFYEDVCEKLGFQIRKEILDNPSKIIDYINIDKDYMEEYIKTYINKFDRTRGETDMLDKFLKTMGYGGVKDYKKQFDLPRYEKSVPTDKIIELVKQKKKYQDIADELGISKNTVIERIRKAKEQGLIPDEVINWGERSLEKRKVKERPSLDQLKKDFEELNSWEKVGQKYNVSSNSIRKWIKGYEKPEGTNLVESQKKNLTSTIEDFLKSYFSENKYICDIVVRKEWDGWFNIVVILDRKSLDNWHPSEISVVAAGTKNNVKSAFKNYFPDLDFGITMFPKNCD